LDCFFRVPVLIVPRGLAQQYYEFLGIAARANGEQLIVDRRRAKRRHWSRSTERERRDAERRRPTPPSWSRDNLIFVP
jgi:hypothetical protein